MTQLAKPSFLRRLLGRVFYHDLLWHGGLPQAVDAALHQLGSQLRVTPEGDWFVAYARVESGRRYSQIYVAAHGRCFLFDCWDRGACLANGSTWSLMRLARAVDRWVGTDCTTATLASECKFVDPKPAAAMYERGEELEGTWQEHITEAEKRLKREHWEWDRWDEFLMAASRRPELRQLFPIPSFMFSFSRCTRYPFTSDTPMVGCGGDAGYSVFAAADHRLVGRGDAEYAADLVVRHLPEGCGPAVVGTAEDLARRSQEGPE